MFAADRVEACMINSQPERVHLSKIKWQPANRGWQGILPMHVHAIAHDIVTQGTSTRRYKSVELIEAPKPMLPHLKTMSTTGPFYANLSNTHFCIAHQLIAEGGLRDQDQPDGLRLEQRAHDAEGALIHSTGVLATAYSIELRSDTPAILPVMREDNLVDNVVSRLA